MLKNIHVYLCWLVASVVWGQIIETRPKQTSQLKPIGKSQPLLLDYAGKASNRKVPYAALPKGPPAQPGLNIFGCLDFW